MATSNNTYPANCSAEYPESSSRILALLGFLFWIKLVALIPHFIVLYFLGMISPLMTWIVYLWVTFTGKYPRGLFDFQVGVIRWNFRVNCWGIGLTDKYPPFSFDEGGYPTDVSVEYPESSSRILALLGFLFWIKLVALIPHFIVLFFLGMISPLLIWIVYFWVTFTGKYPRSLFDFQAGVLRWGFRVNCWVIGLTDKYPPFSLK